MKKKIKEKISVQKTPLVPAIPINNISKLDLGCGTRKTGPDWTGVDAIKFDGVDVHLNLTEKLPNGTFKTWPWKDGSIDEVHSSHTVEHLEPAERIHFVNEIYRILKPAAKATIVAPDWSSARAYGDLTHKWPPVSGFWFFYLSKEWRSSQAPHCVDYTCDFSVTWGHSLRDDIRSRSQEYQMFAMANFKDVCLDIIATLVAVK